MRRKVRQQRKQAAMRRNKARAARAREVLVKRRHPMGGRKMKKKDREYMKKLQKHVFQALQVALPMGLRRDTELAIHEATAATTPGTPGAIGKAAAAAAAVVTSLRKHSKSQQEKAAKTIARKVQHHNAQVPRR